MRQQSNALKLKAAWHADCFIGRMTVKELIMDLSKLDQEKQVLFLTGEEADNATFAYKLGVIAESENEVVIWDAGLIE